MKLKKWLKPVDGASFQCNIYMQYEKQTVEGVWETKYDLIYAGSLWSVPYWLVDYEIAPNDKNGQAISFCYNMFKNVDDEEETEGYNGLCIYLQEQGVQ